MIPSPDLWVEDISQSVETNLSRTRAVHWLFLHICISRPCILKCLAYYDEERARVPGRAGKSNECIMSAHVISRGPISLALSSPLTSCSVEFHSRVVPVSSNSFSNLLRSRHATKELLHSLYQNNFKTLTLFSCVYTDGAILQALPPAVAFFAVHEFHSN